MDTMANKISFLTPKEVYRFARVKEGDIHANRGIAESSNHYSGRVKRELWELNLPWRIRKDMSKEMLLSQVLPHDLRHLP